jgi:hypothetical protein
MVDEAEQQEASSGEVHPLLQEALIIRRCAEFSRVQVSCQINPSKN